MIIYKLNEINERIAEMNNNIKGIIDGGEKELFDNLQKYRSEKASIPNNRNLSDEGKDQAIKDLSQKYYDICAAKGKNLIERIEGEYDSSIERINTLTKFDDETKIVNYSKEDVKEIITKNTNLLYAIQVLSNVDKDKGHEELKRLLEQNQEDEKILTLIKMKVDNLQKDKCDTNIFKEVFENIKELSKDHVASLKEYKEKIIKMYKENEYPRTLGTSTHTIKELFEVGKKEFSRFVATGEEEKKDISDFIAK